MEDKQFVLDFSRSHTEYYNIDGKRCITYKFFSDKLTDYSNNIFAVYDNEALYSLGLSLYFNRYEELEEYDVDGFFDIQIRVIWKNLDESIFFLDACVPKLNYGRHRINFVDTAVFKSAMDKEEYDDLLKSIKYLQEHLMDIETVIVDIKEINLDDEKEG